MHSATPNAPPTNIGPYWSDEELIMNLEKMKQGHSIPENVIADFNPYEHEPSNLPEDVWYFVPTAVKKDSKHGIWKAREEAFVVYTNSSIIGWRTTLEYYVGQGPHIERTDWLMQEYKITQKGLHIGGNPKESNLLCRVFRSNCQACSDKEMRLKLHGEIIAGGNHSHQNPPDTGSVTRQGYMNESQARNSNENTRPLPAAGELPGSPMDDYILRGDYLELDDLVNPESRSFSSDNTSCLTLTTDDCFDSGELVRDIEDEINRNAEGKRTNLKLSIAAPARVDEVVMKPATLESLISSNGKKLPTGAAVDKKVNKKVPGNVAKTQKVENRNQGASSSRCVASSSNGHKALPEGEKNALARRMKKLKKKYLCFMPF